LRVCYEAGPTGYVLYWQLSELGVKCEVVAPTLVPVKAGDRVKTDRRDAEKLARCYRAGDLTAVWVPDAAHEALRDLVRARLAAKRDQLRARHRLSKFLLRHGRRARLHQRYTRLMARGKCKQQVVTAVGRELLGFIWAIGVHVEREESAPLRRAA
jgi:transposase